LASLLVAATLLNIKRMSDGDEVHNEDQVMDRIEHLIRNMVAKVTGNTYQ